MKNRKREIRTSGSVRDEGGQHPVGEAEESERGTIRLRMVGPIWSVVAEIDEARLVGMESESTRVRAALLRRSA
jgi:hypothetical protein